jgi:hypothetical protein
MPSSQPPCRHAASTPSGSDQYRQDEGHTGKCDGRLDALADELRDGLLREERFAKVAVEQLPAPTPELHWQRLRKAQFASHLLQVLGAGTVADDGCSRIAGCQPRHEEHDQRDHDEHGQGGGNAPQKECEHGVFSSW